jgi:site-specific DNA recombinase
LLPKLRDLGIRLAVVDEPQLGTSAADLLVLNIIGSFAEFEYEMIRDRLADTRAGMKRKGLRVAGRVPYGYITEPVTKQLVPVTQEARRVRAIFRWASEGKKLSEIAILANGRGWKTKPSNRHSNGGRWTPRQVAELLANPVYVGRIRVKTDTAPGKHEALIDQDLFDRVREIVSSRRVSTGPRKAPSNAWPLRGKVVCARCNRPMNTSVLHHKQRRYHYYRCRSNAGGRPPCKGVSVQAYQLERLVCAQLSALKPQKLRHPSRRQFFADFAPLWAQLDDREQLRALGDVVQQVDFDPDGGKLRVTIQVGAVGTVAGILTNRAREAR